MEPLAQQRLASRRASYSQLSTALAHMDNREFSSTLKPPNRRFRTWGHSYVSSVGGTSVFVKRIPLTEVEAAQPWSTRNIFRLPTYYNYGVGSLGFGAFRELMGHIKTTGATLEGATSNFPMLYHHRVLARTARRGADPAFVDHYVKRWNSSSAVRSLMTARASAPQEIWLVLEHVPHALSGWLMDHQDRIDDVIRQICEAVSFMRTREMVHFDMHFANVMTDGHLLYVADFGLVNDEAFHLTKAERAFLARHSHYDYAESIASIGTAPGWALETMDPSIRAKVLRTYGWLRSSTTMQEFARAVIDNADSMREGPLKIDPAYAAALRRFRELILYMAGFLGDLRLNPRKNTPYDDDLVRRLLEDAGIPLEWSA